MFDAMFQPQLDHIPPFGWLLVHINAALVALQVVVWGGQVVSKTGNLLS